MVPPPKNQTVRILAASILPGLLGGWHVQVASASYVLDKNVTVHHCLRFGIWSNRLSRLV